MQGRRSLAVGVTCLLASSTHGAAAQAPVAPPSSVPGAGASEGGGVPAQAPSRSVPPEETIPAQPPAAVGAMPPVEPAAAPPAQPEAGPAPEPAAPLPPPAMPVTPTPAVHARAELRASPAPQTLPGDGDEGAARREATRPHGALSLELSVGAVAAARFPDARGQSSEEALDGSFSLGAFVGSETLSLGLVVERLGLGKDHYAANAAGETLNASYLVDNLWVAGRLHLTPERPSLYLGAAIGPSLPRLRGAGTRASPDAFSRPAEPFQCSDAGRLGAGLALALGVEADVASDWSLLGEARAIGHLLSAAGDGHGTCGPGSGPAVGGALRIGVAYRFGS